MVITTDDMHRLVVHCTISAEVAYEKNLDSYGDFSIQLDDTVRAAFSIPALEEALREVVLHQVVVKVQGMELEDLRTAIAERVLLEESARLECDAHEVKGEA